MATSYWLHPLLYDPDDNSGPYAQLLKQYQYPELYKLSKFVADKRDYWEMGNVVKLDDQRDYWSSHFFSYPTDLTKVLVGEGSTPGLNNYYNNIRNANVEANKGSYYYDARRILIFATLTNRQREFVYQFLNAYVSRTKSHQEIFFNTLADEERYDSVVDSVWKIARLMWERMPSV